MNSSSNILICRTEDGKAKIQTRPVQKELNKWKKAAKCAVKDKKYIAVIEEFKDDCGSVFEY